MTSLIAEINELKEQRGAKILAHYYQEGSIQDIADHVADSLGMAQYGKDAPGDVLLVAGVHFMGETAKILSPEKTVLVPDLNAGCSLADNCPPDAFEKFVKAHPNHTVVSYVNCSAEVKALSDILCTSSNAVAIINSIPESNPIIFAPDKHLGAYLQKQTGRDLLLWDGACIVHEAFNAKKLSQLKALHPDALVAAHPECPQNVLALADHIGSTSSILKYVQETDNKSFIVVTETGILHQMKKSCPDKEFIPLANDESTCNCAECPHMRLNTLEKIRNALRDLSPEIIIPEEIRLRAVKPLERMLDLSSSTLQKAS